MKIKICGLFRTCDIDYVNEAQPDYVGFVFAQSRRQVSPRQAAEMKKRLDGRIAAVGVFVNEKLETVQGLLRQGVIDLVQLHGDESDEYIQKLNAPVIKAVRPGQPHRRPCAFLLFDGPKAGSGEPFDWAKLPKTQTPFFLAGGICSENLEEAMRLNPYGIDLSSGAETGGCKDREKILEMVRRVRNA